MYTYEGEINALAIPVQFRAECLKQIIMLYLDAIDFSIKMYKILKVHYSSEDNTSNTILKKKINTI